MIINAKKYISTYKCDKQVAHYLIYTIGLPVLDVDKDWYYFLDDSSLRNILGRMPLWLKVIDKLTPR
jgi:hypothetical protein